MQASNRKPFSSRCGASRVQYVDGSPEQYGEDSVLAQPGRFDCGDPKENTTHVGTSIAIGTTKFRPYSSNIGVRFIYTAFGYVCQGRAVRCEPDNLEIEETVESPRSVGDLKDGDVRAISCPPGGKPINWLQLSDDLEWRFSACWREASSSNCLLGTFSGTMTKESFLQLASMGRSVSCSIPKLGSFTVSPESIGDIRAIAHKIGH